MSPGARRWKLVPHFLLRRAGFPFSCLTDVGMPESSRLAFRLAEAGAQQEALRDALLRTHFPAEVRRAQQAGDRTALRVLSRWRKKVGRRQEMAPPPGTWSPSLVLAFEAWTAAGCDLRTLDPPLQAALEREQQTARERLRSFFARDDVAEALFLLSPDLVEKSSGKLRRPPTTKPDAEERALERRLYAFLQRLAAKNETTSFFGPLAYGTVEGPGGGLRVGAERPGGVTHARAFPAFWCVAALAKRIGAEPGIRGALPPRRVSVSYLEGNEGVGPDGRRKPLSEDAVRLFSLVDGVRSVSTLAEALGIGEAQVEAGVVELERALLVRRDLEPLSTSTSPLADLKAQLPPTPQAAPWRERLLQFEQDVARFETARGQARRQAFHAIEARFKDLTGLSPRRAAGETYADRTLVYEDCLGDLHPIHLGEDEAARIERAFSPVLELGAAYGQLRHKAFRSLAASTLRALGGNARFLHFSEALDRRVAAGALAPLFREADAWLARLCSVIQGLGPGRIARLAPEHLEPFLQTTKGAPRFASPDILFERWAATGGSTPGGHRYVIGEVHPYVFAWGSQNQFAPAPEVLQAAFCADLSPWGGRERLAVVLRRRRHKGLVEASFPGTFIEVSGRASHDAGRTVPIAELRVSFQNGTEEPVLVGPRGALTLYVGEDDHPHLRAFAPPAVEMPPIRLGPHTPRIEVGDVVLQRERWTLEGDAFERLRRATTPAQLAVQVAAARQRHGWPRVVFAWSPTETKPLCLDLEAHLGRRALQRLLRLGRVTLTEMLPSPEGLYLQRSDGAFTSELRTAFLCEEGSGASTRPSSFEG